MGGEGMIHNNLTKFPALSLFQKAYRIVEMTPLTKLWPRLPELLSPLAMEDQYDQDPMFQNNTIESLRQS